MQLMVCNLDRSRFTPFVCSALDGERRALLKEAGVPVILNSDLFRVINQLKPDIVHIHRAGWPEPGFLKPLRLLRPRVVVETNVFGRLDGTPLGGVIDKHLFVSQFCLERFAAEFGPSVDLSRYQVLHNPVDTDLLGLTAPERDFSRTVAGRLSRADPGKWSRLAFDMLEHLKAAHPDFKFLVLGATPEFEDFVRERGLFANVEILPPLVRDEDLSSFFGRMSLLAHANDTGESFGMAIAEAMAAGLPVVTHPTRGNRDNAQVELVEHGVTGLVANTVEEYAGAVSWLWTHPDEARRMGLAGREKAARLYRVQNITRALEDIYQELLDRPCQP
jgi:glycosyltransferase involved in cell wall biosynthesis